MNLTIELPDQDVQVLKAKATARGVSAEQGSSGAGSGCRGHTPGAQAIR